MYMHIDRENIAGVWADAKGFINVLALGTPQINAMPLSPQEQTILLSLLHKLNSCRENIQVKGVWPLLSLAFGERSGVVLYAWFKGWSVEVGELFSKGFLRDLEDVCRVLECIDVDVECFLEKFNEFYKQINSINAVSLERNHIILGQQQIYQQNQYDSDPDTQFFERIRQLEEDDTIFRRFSMFEPQMPQFIESEDEHEEQETITISFQKRQFPPQPRRRVKKLSHRPTPRTRRQRLICQLRNKQTSLIALTSKRQQARKVKGTKYLLERARGAPRDRGQGDLYQHRDKGQGDLCRDRGDREGERGDRGDRGDRRRKRLEKELRRLDDRTLQGGRDGMDLEGEYDDDDEFQCVESDSEQDRNKNVNLSARRLSKNVMEQRDNQFEIDENDHQNLIVNESIQNLQVKKINFPTTVQDLKRIELFFDEDDRFFDMQTITGFLEAYDKEKQKLQQIKYIVNQKDDTSVESFMVCFAVYQNGSMQKYKKNHLKPLLMHKLGVMVSKILSEIINILYTNFDNDEFIALFRECKQIILIHEQVKQISKQFQKQLSQLIMQQLSELIKDTHRKILRVASFIQFPRPFQIVQQFMKIKLAQNHLIQSVLVAVQILVQGFVKNMLGNFVNDQTIKSYREHVYQCYRLKVQNKPKFMKIICEIFIKFNVTILRRQDLQLVLGFANDIDLKELEKSPSRAEKQSFVEIMPDLIHSFILQKQAKDVNFNFKPALSYISTSPFIDACRKSQTEIGQKIILQTYEVLLQFPKFQNGVTIKQIIPFIKNIEYEERFQKSFWVAIFKLLSKCYEIKCNEKKQNKVDFIQNFQIEKYTHFQENQDIEKTFEKLIKIFLKQYKQVSTHIKQKALEKMAKYQSLVESFIQQFINNENLKVFLNHYFVSLKFLLEYVVPLIQASKKQSLFIQNISKSCCEKFKMIPEIFEMLSKQIELKFISSNMIEDDMDEQQLLFFQKQEQRNIHKKVIQVLHTFVNVISPYDNTKLLSISLQNMQDAKSQIFYEIQGILSVFYLLNGPNVSKMKNSFMRIFSSHSRQVRIVKSQNLFKSTNKLLCEYLKGFLYMCRIFLIDKCVGTKLQEIGSLTMENIFDVLLIGLTCEKQIKYVIELINIANKIPYLGNCNHVLTLVKLSNKLTDLSSFYSSLMEKKEKISSQMLSKFKQYLSVWASLYQKYCDLNWTHFRSHICNSVIEAFDFLVKIEANIQILNEYRPYFILSSPDIQMGNNNNFLRGLEIKQSNSFYAISVVKLFRNVSIQRKVTLEKTWQIYLSYNVNLALTVDKNQHNFGPSSGNLTRVKILIDAIQKECVMSPFFDCDLGFSIMKPDSFSLNSVQILLNDLIIKANLKQSVKDKVVGFFFSLWKRFPKLDEVYMRLLKIHHDKMDKIIKNNANLDLMACQSLQDALKKFVVRNTNEFDHLHSILLYRSRIPSNFKTNSIKQLKQIIDICLKRLEEKQSSNSTIFNKFLKLKQNIRQQEQRDWKSKIGFQQYFLDQNYHKQNQIHNGSEIIRK